jgi:maltose/moltooligosaccharide transporter
MSFGFLGIQFGWALQMANMSAIYEFLGAKPDEIPLLWLAAPMTGLLVQPIVGYLSDRTWSPRFGRRKPFFLLGALMASVALIAMPSSSAIWMAAGLLWILDASINISMEPFRAFVADMLPEEQQTRGFTMQSMFIGLGAVIASALPYLFTHFFGAGADECNNLSAIPESVKLSFYVGSVAFIGAVVFTVLTTKEYPPADEAALREQNKNSRGFTHGLRTIVQAIVNMPTTMRQLAVVQFLTWPGLFLMWFYFGTATTRSVFNYDDSLTVYEPYYKQMKCLEKATGQQPDFNAIVKAVPPGTGTLTAYELTSTFHNPARFGELLAENVKKRTDGNEWGGICFAFYSLITFLVSFILPLFVGRVGRKTTHALCLLIGAIGLLAVGYIKEPFALLYSMACVGIAWASILSLPYAMLAPALPAGQTGIYMGIFNFFIVIPEILATLGFGWVMNHILDNNRVYAVMMGGGLLILASIMTWSVREKQST